MVPCNSGVDPSSDSALGAAFQEGCNSPVPIEDTLTPQQTRIDTAAKANLGRRLKLLFAISGATSQVSQLALLSIVNDRVAIPLSYLPAYSAIAFLPYSLKPLYAFLGSRACGEHNDAQLLAATLAINAVAYLGTTSLIPTGGILPCFLWAFIRGVSGAWSEFLMNQSIIRKAQEKGDPSSNAYQALTSIFQSQAMTCSSSGSLIASLGSFLIFAYRQMQCTNTSGKVAPLNESTVIGLLTASASLSMVACVLATFWDWADSTPSSTSRQTIHYDSVSASESTLGFLDQNQTSSASNDSDPLSSSFRGEEDERVDPLLHRNRASSDSASPPREKQKQSYLICLVLLQIILIGAALKEPILSLVGNQLVWNIPMVTLGLCLVGTFVATPFPGSSGSQQRDDGSAYNRIQSHIVPPMQLGIYLILHHSVPIASTLTYYYIYTLFGEREPIFLQFLLIVESSASVMDTLLAEQFHSGWGIIGLTAILSIVAALVSLLDIIIVLKAKGNNNDDGSECHVDKKLHVLVVAISTATYFMGEIAYMPSVVLSTTNIVSPSESNGALAERATASRPEPTTDGGGYTRNTSPPLYDEGMQYASFVAGIDFGSQLGNWIAVPVIKHFEITRENHWANLEQYIILCALFRIVSIAFLWIIRPPHEEVYTISTGSTLSVNP
eukprot:scaffold4676_cov164-Amphora_coffeaeformis.AAC.3